MTLCDVCGRARAGPEGVGVPGTPISAMCFRADATAGCVGWIDPSCFAIGYERLRTGYDARGLTIKSYEEEIEKLVRENNALRPVPATSLDILRLELERTPEEHRAGMEKQMARADALGNDNFRLREALAQAVSSRDQMGAALREARDFIYGTSLVSWQEQLARIDLALASGATGLPQRPGDRAEKEGEG